MKMTEFGGVKIRIRFQQSKDWGLQRWVDGGRESRQRGEMWSRLAKGLVGWSAGEALQIWAIPAIGTGASVVIGWAQGVPWFYIYIGATVSFAAITTGVLSFSKWRHRSKALDKLAFSSVRVGQKLLDDGRTGSVRLGLVVSNKASFPMEFEIKRLLTSVGSHHSPKKDYKKNSFVLPMNGTGWFDDHDIDINSRITGKEEGIIEFVLSYGRPGNLKHELKQKKRVYFSVSDNGRITSCNWTDE